MQPLPLLLAMLCLSGAAGILPQSAIALPMATAARLTEVDITQRLQTLPAPWTRDGQVLRYRRSFTNFIEAIAFVNRLVEPAETLGHHPDITINYNRVTLELTTHDAGGLTVLDFQLAEAIAQL